MKLLKWFLIVAGAVLFSYLLSNMAIGGSQDMAEDMFGAALWLLLAIVFVIIGFFVNKYLEKSTSY